ncbi:unnamed protein product [Notodromas monacha]|uniref:GPI ethanolamine phosphate transferase 1 n=1 Tax=Notodromas monacha TaxID=399045 RepID=A0A7R9GBZ3_9CRUS|nr:unnamed protein product [Notodromas monacha]CAG0915311.1 unnamed protein product [Notodromas monacha]
MANVPKFFIFSLLCRVLFFLSVFEIHFKSPIIHGITDVQVDWISAEPRAKRIVIFIADGLRYDKWQEFITLQPSRFWARTSKGDHCSVGISNTRVPTKTHPGHVALLAGIYEDPSAVFRGWQDNPVDFDSVLNKSSTSVSWGAPDVVLMFRKGGAERHSKFYAYDHDTVDFAEKNASFTDAWVFNEVQKFFEYGDMRMVKPYAVKVTLTNALQLLSQVEALEQMQASSISYRSFPFRELEDRQDRITRIKVFIRSSNFEKAVMEIISLRSLAAEALEYYQFLRKPAMMLSLLCSYVIWLGIVYNCKAWRSLEFCSDEQLYPGPIAEKSPDFRQIRRPVFLVIYALLAFFGTGNLASINSFDPTAVYCFVTIFGN